jgi:signal peptide peptidase SppA
MEPQEKFANLKGFLYGTLVGNVVSLIIVLAFVYVLISLVRVPDYSVGGEEVADEYSYGDESCNLSGINLHGSLLTYIPEHAEGDTYFDYDVTSSEDVLWYIDEANNNEDVKAIVIEVDSYGGSPVAGEEISNAVKNSGKPVVAFIREVGASAAYLAVSSADKIFASKNSDVGSIGVTMSYLNNVEKNKNEGYAYENLSIGKYKDSGTPDKSLTEEERKLFLRDLNIIYENFVEEISTNRNIPVEKVRSFADGSTVLGEKAKELGLIDEIGGIYEVQKYLEETIGEKPEICW